MIVKINNTTYCAYGKYNPNEIGCEMCDLDYSTCCYLCADKGCEFLKRR